MFLLSDLVQQKQKLSDWGNRTLPEGTISASQVKQGLKLSPELEARLEVKSLDLNWTKTHGASQVFGISEEWSAPFADYSGDVLQATWTNLKRSSYVDAQGNTHKISKIVMTLRNVICDKAEDGDSNSQNYRPKFMFFREPTKSFWYDYVSSADIHTVYIDDQGNAITFAPGTAYLSVLSLNRSEARTEGVQALSGTPLALEGSSVVLHNDGLYADRNNDELWVDDAGNAHAIDQDHHRNWDEPVTYPYTYFGSGLIELAGSSADYRIFTKRLYGNNPTWFQNSTIIPTTLIPETKINYHFTTIRCVPRLQNGKKWRNFFFCQNNLSFAM